MKKLFVIVRGDLVPGSKIAQAVHGKDEFQEAHPEEHRRWRTESNTIVVLQARDEGHLWVLREKAQSKDIPHAVFHEPDLSDSLTCLVLADTDGTKSITSKLPLAH